MSPEDICRTTFSGGGTSTSDYNDAVRDYEQAWPIALWFALPAIGLGAACLVCGVLLRRASVRIPEGDDHSGQEAAVERLLEEFEQTGSLQLGELALSGTGASDAHGNHLPWSTDWRVIGIRAPKKRAQIVVDAPGKRWLSAAVPNVPKARTLLRILAIYHTAPEGSDSVP